MLAVLCLKLVPWNSEPDSVLAKIAARHQCSELSLVVRRLYGHSLIKLTVNYFRQHTYYHI